MAITFEQAKNFIPGGVNSPVRAFSSVDRNPFFVKRSDGAYLYDTNDKAYIDFIGSWGPMISGHNHPRIREAVIEAANNGTSFGACTEREVEIAETICSLVPSVEMVRLVNSGTEATMSAVRLARGFTGKDKIIKFRGCYHGHGDSFLIEAGSGALTHGEPSSPGVTSGTAKDTLLANYNQLDSVEKIFESNKEEVACVILEPIAGNMGVIPPAEGFLSGLRKLCDKQHSLLIFDEVMCGFRVGLSGAQGLYGVNPDLSTFGKIIGGGLPVGAYGGRKDIMSQLSPAGPIYQAGTLSGNPLATAAGLAALNEIKAPGFYETLETRAQKWELDITKALTAVKINHTINRVGSMMTVFFKEGSVTNYQDATSCDTEFFAKWFNALLDEGVLVAPSQFEAGFLSIAHNDEILEKTKVATQNAMQKLARD